MKFPWKVAYKPLFEEWDPKSGPRIVNADGEFLFSMPQSEDVGHPGLYDEKADKLAHLIVEAVNEKHYKPPGPLWDVREFD